MNLEQSLIDFLKAGKQLEYNEDEAEPGRVGLCGYDELKEEAIDVWGPDQKFYSVPAVSLTNECNEEYEPHYILLWLPNEKVYGTWDCDDGYLTVFPGVTWNDIANDPLPYINCGWDLDDKIGEAFDPTGNYTPQP